MGATPSARRSSRCTYPGTERIPGANTRGDSQIGPERVMTKGGAIVPDERDFDGNSELRDIVVTLLALVLPPESANWS